MTVKYTFTIAVVAVSVSLVYSSHKRDILNSNFFRITGIHARNMKTPLLARSVLDDLTVLGSDQGVTVGAVGEIVAKIQGCIICVLEQEQPLLMLLSKPIKHVLPRFAYFLGEPRFF